MRIALLFVLGLAACAPGGGTPFTWPVDPVQIGLNVAAYSQRRGMVELAVKAGFPAILDQISAGQGPVLAQALQAAGVPAQDQPARTLQLQGDLGLYAANPGALVTALMLYGG